MNKNEYRRAFIMLRPALTGYSGHVRLERRTMTGSMYFIVSAPGEGLNAALVGQRGGEYYAAPLGVLKRDARGQLTLACAFDPRSIGGRPLEAYQLLAVAQVNGGDCKVALTGNVDGAYPMDAAAVREAVCALYQTDQPADDLPAPGELEPMPEPEPAPETAPETVPEPAPEDVPPEPLCPVDSEAPLPTEATGDPEPEPTPRPAVIVLPGPVPEGPDLVEPEPARTKIYTRMRARQAEPAVESTPEPTAAMESLPATLPLEDGYTYIQTPLPAASGAGWCLVGVRTKGDRITSVRCAMPGAYAPHPPEGLQGCVWVGRGDGSDGGYWVYTSRDVDSGAVPVL